MAVQIIRYRSGKSGAQWGVVDGRTIRPVSGTYPTTADFLLKGSPRARKLAAAKRSKGAKKILIEKVEILSPVTADAQIVCQGKNYTEHIKETGFRPEDKSYNLLFTKASSSLTGARGTVLRPRGVRLLDYELELGLVIGRPPERGGSVNPADCVAALVIANDISARDIQVPQGQWFKGKSYRTFCPVGPYLVLLDRDELDHLGDLELVLRVNGEIRQRAHMRQMLFAPAETLTEIAGLMELRPGDLVLTGTPAGVAMQIPRGWKVKLARLFLSEPALMKKFVESQAASGRYLKDEDVIHASIRNSDDSIDLGMQELVIKSVTG